MALSEITTENNHAALSAEERKTLRGQLRKEIISKRSKMSNELRQKKSLQICTELFEALKRFAAEKSIALEACTVGVYSAFPEEVQLDRFIQKAYANGVTVAFPCMIKDSWRTENACHQTMEMRKVSRENYQSNNVDFLLHPLHEYFHASEDIAEHPYAPATELTMLICPLVGFDSKGNRLGYGGGNYDRYLTQIDKNTLVLGVAFEEQRIEEVPIESHDIPLAILSE